MNLASKGTLRRKILAYVVPMVLLSLLSSAISLYRMTEVNGLLEAINHVSVPLGRLFTQMQSDAEVFHREFERNLGYLHWKDTHWKPRPAPQWIENVLKNEITRIQDLLNSPLDWTTPETRGYWQDWAKQVKERLQSLSEQSTKLYLALDQKDTLGASEIYTRWTAGVSEWKRQLQWAALEYERSLRKSFATTERRVFELRTGLEIVLVVVVMMCLLLLWFGERTLRPLEDLTRLARDITRRGLRKEDKSLLPEIPLSRSDEVSQLAREFHSMATALLEREKTVEAQKNRLQEQNRLLRDMGEAKRRAENLAAIGRMSAQVAHEVRNPLHSIGLEAEMAIELASRAGNTSLKQSLQSILNSVDRLQKITENYLKFSRLSSGRKQGIHLNEILKSVLDTYTPVCEVQGVEVYFKCEAEARLQIWGDPDLIEQLLGNLFRNALQALEGSSFQAPHTARITWSFGNTESGQVWFRIEDNGPGIMPEIKEKLFTPFVTTRAEGTGLGLSFAKKVVEDHGGNIQILDRALGEGACFEVSLPLMEAVAQEMSPEMIKEGMIHV